MPWLTTFVVIEGREYAHVIPLDDQIDHERSRACVCGPKFRQELGTGAEYTWMVIHDSLDGRELVE